MKKLFFMTAVGKFAYIYTHTHAWTAGRSVTLHGCMSDVIGTAGLGFFLLSFE